MRGVRKDGLLINYLGIIGHSYGKRINPYLTPYTKPKFQIYSKPNYEKPKCKAFRRYGENTQQLSISKIGHKIYVTEENMDPFYCAIVVNFCMIKGF